MLEIAQVDTTEQWFNENLPIYMSFTTQILETVASIGASIRAFWIDQGNLKKKDKKNNWDL